MPHLCQLSKQCVSTPTECHNTTVTVCYTAQQGSNLVVANGWVNQVTKSEELVSAKSAQLMVINKLERLRNGAQGTLMKLKIPSQNHLQTYSAVYTLWERRH